MWNDDNANCPGGCFRPVGLTLDRKGRVFMTSDSSGELYVITGTSAPGVKKNGLRSAYQKLLRK